MRSALHARLGRRVAALGLLLAVAPSVWAGDAEDAADAVADGYEERRAKGAAAARLVPDPPEPTSSQKRALRAIVEQAEGKAQQRRQQHREYAASSAEPDGRVFHVFVSRSLGEGELRGIFARAARHANVEILFRGVPKGTRIDTAVRRMGKLVRAVEGTPTVKLDPPAFRAYGVDAVPTMIVTRDGEVVARATGTTSIQGMKRRLAAGQAGDLGRLGPVVEISEPDLVQVMKRRASQLDMARIRARAKHSYWADVPFNRLEVAQEPRTRTVDPTVVVQRDIKTPNGEVIARKGERLNPLERHPFRMRLVVFDATDPRQLRAAEALADGPGRAIFLATAFDRERGWDHYRAVSNRLDRQVYRLTAQLEQRFRLERVPAVVTGVGNRFKIREVPARRYARAGERPAAAEQ